MARIIGYARVSSREQAENSHALEQQVARLRAAGAEDVITDVQSGSKANRAGLQQIMQLVEEQRIEEVIITRLDRLARSIVTTKKVIDLFRRQEVNLRALDDALDLKTSAGRLHINIISVFAEAEADLLSERVQHGWQNLRDRKVAMNPPFGYIKVDDRFALDHTPFLCLLDDQHMYTKAEVARWCIEAFFQAKSLRGAIRLINERYGIRTFANPAGTTGRTARGVFRWSPTGYRGWLTSPVLCGHTCYRRKVKGQRRLQQDWDVHYNTHPQQRLLSDVEAVDIATILKLNRQHRGYGAESKPKYPLSGLVYCAECR
ncbi:MAG: recombinase family protein, partial [Phormidesmis sp.]